MPEAHRDLIVEATQAQIDQYAKTTEQAKKILGMDAVCAFQNIVQHPTLLEIDALHYNGHLAVDELSEYIAQLPEYIDIRRKRMEAVVKAVMMLKAKTPYYLQQSEGGATWFKPESRIFSILDFIYAFAHTYDTTRPSVSNREINEYLKTLYTLYLHEIFIQCRTAQRNAWEALIQRWSISDQENTSLTAAATYTYGMRYLADTRMLASYQKFLQQEQGVVPLKDALIRDTSPATRQHAKQPMICVAPMAHNPLEIRKENEQLAAVIDQQSLFRRICGSVEEITEQVTLLFAAEQQNISMFRVHRQNIMAIGRLCFDIKHVSPPKLVSVSEHGREEMAYKNIAYHPHILDFSVEKGTGEIVLTGSHVPLAFLMPEQEYETLRRLILRSLHKQFLREEPDIKELLIGTGEPSSNESLDAAAEELIEYCSHVRTDVADHTDAPLEDTSHANTTTEIIGKNIERIYRVISNAGGMKILSALKRTLGEPVRISGSHHIFESIIHPGQRCPIPIHGSDPVSLGVLKNFLQTMGLSPMDLHKAL